MMNEKPVTIDDIMERLGQFEEVRKTRDYLRKEVDRLRHQNAALLKSPALGNVCIVIGSVSWCNDDHRIILDQGWFEWLITDTDLVVGLDDVVRVVGTIEQQPEDDPDGGIGRRFRIKALSAEIVVARDDEDPAPDRQPGEGGVR